MKKRILSLFCVLVLLAGALPSASALQGEAARARRAGYGKTYFDRYAPADTSGLMPSGVFVDKLLTVAGNFKTLYIMGCFGAPMTPENKKRYTQNHDYNKAADRVKMINAASADTFGFDCVNLIKGILWGWSGDASKRYGGATYPTAAAFAAGPARTSRRTA